MTGQMKSPIGVFDSGYGGLTILRDIQRKLPQYNYLYLGDNARAPYGTRSFDIVYRFTLQAVEELFSRGCRLVILACNTASAKALRSIQQNDLPRLDPSRRVLGIIRPTVEALGQLTATGHIGLFATPGTVRSESYRMEVEKLFPNMTLTGHACPMWVPLVEHNEADNPGADYFVEKDINLLMQSDPEIDTVILGCTHYPLLYHKIRHYLPERIKLISQGGIVADSLADYLRRHPEIEQTLAQDGHTDYLTTERADSFSRMATLFLRTPVDARQITLS